MTRDVKQCGQRLSVIVPAHNAASTLDRCVGSVFEAEAPMAVEVIIVENGSRDNTLDAAWALSRKWPESVRVLTSETGVSNARNAGLDAAVGDWVCFLDADDRLNIAALCAMAEHAAKAEADIAVGDILRRYRNSAEAHRYADASTLWQDSRVSDFGNEVLRPQTFMGTVWGKVFNRAWLEDNRLRFDPALSLAEDAAFMFRCSTLAVRVLYLPVECYEYDLNMDSAVRHFCESLPRRYIDAIHALKSEIEATGPETYRDRFDSFAVYHLLLIAVNHSFHPNNPRLPRQRLRDYRDLARSEPFASALAHIHYGDFSISRKIPLFFTAHRFYPGVMLIAAVRHAMFRLK